MSKPILKGKMVAPGKMRNRSEQKKLPKFVKMEIMIYMDILYVNGNPFLHVKSKDINYISIEKLQNKKIKTVSDKLRRICNMYEKRGFVITDAYSDNEFDNDEYRNVVAPARLHICSRGEHVPIVERSIRTIKERARSVLQGLPYRRIPRVMIQSLMGQIAQWLNAFPSVNGLDQPSPARLVNGDDKPDYANKRVMFGSHAMVYVGTDNSMDTRAVPSIAMEQSNIFGGYRFLSLETGKVLHSNKWVSVPINDDVIDILDDLAAKQNQPCMENNYPIFELIPGNTFNIEEDDESIVEHPVDDGEILDVPMVSDESGSETDADDTDEGACLEEQEQLNRPTLTYDEVTLVDEDSLSCQEDFSNIRDEEDGVGRDEDTELDGEEESEDTKDDGFDELYNEHDFRFNIADAYDENTSTDTSAYDGDDGQENDATNEGTEATVRDSRPRRANAGMGVARLEPSMYGKEYVETNRNKAVLTQLPMVNRLVRATFAQMSAKKGFKKYGEKAVASMLKELK